MTATLAGSTAVLTRKYSKGLPKLYFKNFNEYNDVKKYDDWTGDDWSIPIQSESPQGVGPTVANAQAAAVQGTYARFLLTTVNYYGVARITGAALRKAKGPGAIINLWENEISGITSTVMKDCTIYFWGTGNGVKSTATFSTVTATLPSAADAAKYSIGETLQAVSDATLSPTVRSGEAVVSGVDRSAGTLTCATNWTTAITGLTNGDGLVRKGCAAVSATATVPTGVASFAVGGSSPGTLFSLARNPDPVRYAGQVYAAAGQPCDDALVNMETLLAAQQREENIRVWMHPTDYSALKKKAMGKSMIMKSEKGTNKAGFSFEKIVMDGDNGQIDIMRSLFVPLNGPVMMDWSCAGMYSAGPPVGILDFAGGKFMQLAADDGLEVRVGGYLNNALDNPVDVVRSTGYTT